MNPSTPHSAQVARKRALATAALLVVGTSVTRVEAQEPAPLDPVAPAVEPQPSAPIVPPAPPVEPPAAAPSAPEPPEKRVVWNESWPRFRVVEYVYTPIVIGVTLGLEFGTGSAPSSHWEGPILFDTPVRNALVLSTPHARDHANQISDFVTAVPQFYPMLVDPILTPLVLGGTLDVAWQMEAMYLEVMGTTFLVVRLGERYVARARPATLACDSDHGYSDRCSAGPYAGFPSGHTAIAFSGAGLVCAHHQNLPLYGGGIGDGLACGVMLGAATTTGVLRLMADRHYVSDVLVGAALGLGLGYGMPQFLHYRSPFSTTSTRILPGAQIAAVPTASTSSLGVSVLGMF